MGENEMAASKTFTGNQALRIQEPLIFEVGHTGQTGVDVPEPAAHTSRLGALGRKTPIDLPGLTEPETMRHYVRLSRQNYAIDLGLYPLGSCTMKHNPRLNEKMARLPGFGDIHPLQPLSTVPGALELMKTLSAWLLKMTDMKAVALSPKAGAQGELAGMMAIRAAIAAKGETRGTVLVPESAHGTNPATAAALGYKVEGIKARADGTVSVEAVKEKLGPHVAAIMLTNPNTCGLFEPEAAAIADAIHEAGAYFYGDGANFNAIVGKVKPGSIGVDAMHINLHKTFSTPHGGGGPGSGPVVLSERLAPFAPVPFFRGDELVERVEDAAEGEMPFGRLTAFHGQMGMYVRAMAYMMSHGSDGLKQASEDAVLSANYIKASLADLMSVAFPDRPAMHEVLFDDRFLKDTGITTLDFAKAMIDEGFHPMTMYFPLVVPGAMLIEPTESESLASLDIFIAALRDLAMAAKRGDTERFTEAPRYAPRRRLDETKGARKPVLTYEAPQPVLDAAE
ncbi:glycine dehydrogenase subunit 2 [Stappia sp. 22II-S9-Z10]|nr:glycine dehydrogenase subunit 2 [Stappia sp. 22II-S9-Z10]